VPGRCATTSSGVSEYDDSTVPRAETIHLLFGLGFPSEVVQSVLACTGDAPDSSHEVLAEQLKVVESELAERIERLTDTHRQIVAFLEQWGD
jgi:DNA-binding transcriptional MerR regulator